MTRQEAFQLLVKLCAHSVPIPNGAVVKICHENGSGGTEMGGAALGRLLIVPQGVFGAFVDWLADEVAQAACGSEADDEDHYRKQGIYVEPDCSVEDCVREECDGCPDYESGAGREADRMDLDGGGRIPDGRRQRETAEAWELVEVWCHENLRAFLCRALLDLREKLAKHENKLAEDAHGCGAGCEASRAADAARAHALEDLEGR